MDPDSAGKLAILISKSGDLKKHLTEMSAAPLISISDHLSGLRTSDDDNVRG